MAKNNSIILAKHVDTNNITYEGPLANNYGGKYAKVLHNGRWLQIQTPKVMSPFGVNVYEETDKQGNVTKKAYSVDLSFKGYAEDPENKIEFNPKVNELYQMIINMEKSLVEHAHKNCFTWIDNPDASEPVCKALLRSSIKWSRDKNTKQINHKYAPRLKLNLPVYDDGMGFKAFLNGRDTPISSIDELLKVAQGRCEMVAICKCDKVTFNGGKYGFKWSIQQLKVFSNVGNMNSYAFIEDSDDEDETQNDKTITNIVSDSDDDLDTNPTHNVNNDEEEDEDEEEEELPPVQQPIKKTTRIIKKK